MSSLEQGTQENLKKVLRTAIVGVRPADQIMLKGYLRVLLRLDVELEWVSAKHPQVDLFLISNDFRHAANAKILQGQQHKPVLYTSRTDTGEGQLVDDRLVLPLKCLNGLEKWLTSTVPLLAKVTEESATSLQSNETLASTALNNQTPSSSSDSISRDQASSNEILQSNVNNGINSAYPDVTYTKGSSFSPDNYESIIAFIKAVHKRPLGIYQIIVNNQAIAIAEPSRARVWLKQSEEDQVLPTSYDWRLQSYEGEYPAETAAQDLMQWLWRCAWRQIDVLLPLINDDTPYRLSYWIKPISATKYSANGKRKVANEDRRELLQVMNALENTACDVNDLTRLVAISVKNVKKIIAGLLFSGSLKAESYEYLDTLVGRSSRMTQQNKPIDTVHTINDTVESVAIISDKPIEPTASNTKQTALEALLERRARGEAVAPTTSSPTITPDIETNKATVETTAAQQEKRGFLARLRQKLGL
ncbi:hypothetical protein [Psychrobacter fulvigenes]|uniref:hypothetical protein n=1 Tax=Psychrobacter fulvigenes TaxID=533323 RepID=UPI00191A421F|nr:hypothetical protein [Psychrobacter fulvigenes]